VKGYQKRQKIGWLAESGVRSWHRRICGYEMKQKSMLFGAGQ